MVTFYVTDEFFRIKQNDKVIRNCCLSKQVFIEDVFLGQYLIGYILQRDIPVVDRQVTTTMLVMWYGGCGVEQSVKKSTGKVLYHLLKICTQPTKWGIRLNDETSVDIKFTVQTVNQHPIVITWLVIKMYQRLRYLFRNEFGLQVNGAASVLIRRERERTNKLQVKTIYLLLGRRSVLFLSHTILLYKLC